MNEDIDEEIRELLGPQSLTIRNVRPKNFLNLSIFRDWHSDAIKFVEFTRHLDFKFESVVWKAAPRYSALLGLIAESKRQYFVTSTTPTLRLYRKKVDSDHLLMQCHQSEWCNLADCMINEEYGDRAK